MLYEESSLMLVIQPKNNVLPKNMDFLFINSLNYFMGHEKAAYVFKNEILFQLFWV